MNKPVCEFLEVEVMIEYERLLMCDQLFVDSFSSFILISRH